MKLGKQSLLSSDRPSAGDGNHDSEDISGELVRLERSVNETRRAKRRLEVKIEGLEHDFLCAQKARELGSRAALGVARRLAALFGEALKDEDVISRVQQLQERAREAKETTAVLKSELFQVQASASLRERDTMERTNAIRDEMAASNAEEQELCREIGDLRSEVKAKESSINASKEQLSDVKRRLEIVIGDSEWNPSEVRERIHQNSETYVLEQCGRIAESVGIEFDRRMQVCGFVEELQNRFADLQHRIGPFQEKELRFAQTTEESEAAIVRLNAVNQELEDLKAQRRAFRDRLSTRFPIELDDLQPIMNQETQEQHERTQQIRDAVVKGVSEMGYKWEVPETRERLCTVYLALLAAVGEEMRAVTNERPHEIDLAPILSQIDAVRQLNRRIRATLCTA
jgi:chromosome segregation ATPase